MRLFATIWLLCISLLAATPAATQQAGTPKKPLLGNVYSVPGATATTGRFREAQAFLGQRFEGLADADGKLLIPVRYQDIIVLTPTLAAVRHPVLDGPQSKIWDHPFYLYDIGKGERKQTIP